MSEPLPFRRALLAILGIGFVVIMVAIDQTVVSTALPTIVAELAGFELYAWVATAYLLMSIVTIPIFGRLGDYYGRKPFVIAGILVFVLGSVLCALSGTMLFLVLARALQGVGGGMLIGTAIASIPDLFPEPRTRLRWQVVVSTSFGVANAVGPSLGGFMSHAFGWRSVFYINVPVGLVCLYLVMTGLPHIRHTERVASRIDWPGAGLIMLVLASLQFVLQLVPRHGVTALTGALVIACAGAAVLLVWWERRCPEPLLPMAMFADLTVGGLAVLSVLTGFSMFTMIFYMPLMLQGGFGLTAHESGLLVTPLVVFITVGSIVNGRMVTRIRSPKKMLSVGYALLVVSFTGIALVRASTPHSVIVAFMALGGIGLGFVMPNLTVFAQESVARSQLGIVTAMQQSLRMIGGMIGTAAVGALVSELYENGVERAVEQAKAGAVETALTDPQVLVSESSRERFMRDAAAAGLDGTRLVDAARASLVSAVHWGQLAGLAAALIAFWRVRAVPRITLKKR